MIPAERLEEIETRLNANKKYVASFKFSSDRLTLIADCATLHMTLNDRLHDIDWLLDRVLRLASALDEIYSGRHGTGSARTAKDVAREAIETIL